MGQRSRTGHLAPSYHYYAVARNGFLYATLPDSSSLLGRESGTETSPGINFTHSRTGHG